MKHKLMVLFGAYLLIFILSLPSCVKKDDYVSGSNLFRVTGLDWYVCKVVYDVYNNDTIMSAFQLDKDTVEFKDFAILVKSQIVNVALLTKPYHSFSLINSAYAFTPANPYFDEKIDSIVISANKDFDINHTAGSNLSDVFDIVNNSYGLPNIKDKIHLKDYFNINRPALESFILTLRKAPDNTTDFEFLVKYYQSGVESKTFQFTTKSVVIKKE